MRWFGVDGTRPALARMAEIMQNCANVLQQGIKPHQLALIGPASHTKSSLARHAEVSATIAPVTRPSTVTDARDTRCTSALTRRPRRGAAGGARADA